MSDLKKYMEVFAGMEDLRGRKTGLNEEIGRLSALLDPVEKEALTAEVLGDQGAKQKKSDLIELKTKIRDLGAELEEAEKKFKVCGGLLPELRMRASEELWDIRRKPFEKDLREFVEKLLETAKTEKRLREHFEKILAEFREIDSFCPVDAWAPILEVKPGSVAEETAWEKFIVRMKGLGFDLS